MNRRSLSMELCADYSNIDIFCSKAEELMKELELEHHIFQVQLLLREALTNAVKHGCGMNPDKIIKSRLEITENEFIIKVMDPGPGFNWKTRESSGFHEGSLNAESGRGLVILEKYADEYNFNEKGNEIIIRKKYPKGEEL